VCGWHDYCWADAEIERLIVKNGFRFEVIYRDNDLIEVHVSAWNGAFGGAADVYLGIGQLEEIAAKLQGFPKSPSDTREVILGDFIPRSAGRGVSMRFYCAGKSGRAYVEAKIESDYNPADKAQSVLLLLPVEAAAIDSFVKELRGLGADRIGNAQLKGAI